MSSSTKFFKASFGTVLALVGFTWLLLVGILKNGRTNTVTTLNIQPEAGNLKGVEIMGRDQKLGVHPDQSDLNYMSKRRVPNGPDPIHNRRAGNSRQPPGQA